MSTSFLFRLLVDAESGASHLTTPNLARFAALSTAFSCLSARVMSKCFGSARIIAVAVCCNPRAARPIRCHSIQIFRGAFQCTTSSISGRSMPCGYECGPAATSNSGLTIPKESVQPRPQIDEAFSASVSASRNCADMSALNHLILF